jgi:hypothetical protein
LDTVDSVNLLIFGTAESAVTIIAVSIPILRALLYVSGTAPKPPSTFFLGESVPSSDSLSVPKDISNIADIEQQQPEQRSVTPYQLPMPDVLTSFSIEEGLGRSVVEKDEQPSSNSRFEFDFGFSKESKA